MVVTNNVFLCGGGYGRGNGERSESITVVVGNGGKDEKDNGQVFFVNCIISSSFYRFFYVCPFFFVCQAILFFSFIDIVLFLL